MMSSTTEMPEPVCLINNTEDGKLCINEDAVHILDKITQPVVVVAIVGLYRTGKSYLLNRLAGKNNGFALGKTIESKTKGIWMWCVPHPHKENHTLVLLDTEGLGDVEKGDEKHDTWIFTLAVLLSSTLVYNSTGTIDNNALEKLHYVAKLSEKIHVTCSAGADNECSQSVEFMRVFPSFVWTVRDFTLVLELRGEAITSDEYLENALRLKKGDTDEIQRYNDVRSYLQDFFAVRKCFVLQPPTEPLKMGYLERLQDKELNPSFLEKANAFCQYIFTESKVKTMRDGLTLTGRMLSTLAETYIWAIRSGQVPTLDSAVESLTLIHNSRAVTEAVQFYRSEMSKRVSFPTETQQELSDIHVSVEKNAISIFNKGSFNDKYGEYQSELKERLKKEYQDFNKQNMEESFKMCKNVISEVFGPLEKAVNEGAYIKPGGYSEYCSVLKGAIKKYRSQKRGGLRSEEVLTAYLSEKSGVVQTILNADIVLSEAERKKEVELCAADMMSSTTEMTEPVCLINNTEDGKLCINEDAVHILDKITQPVVVVAIVGLYRTGKSYLLNRLAGKNSGFALSNTIESKTKGIWMWCVAHPYKENYTLVLLDTEGLGDVGKGDEQHDIWIFTLAVLLSSTLVYNSMGTIDNNAPENLHYVTKLSENINVNSSFDADKHCSQSVEFMRVFPSFVWTVRDFTLQYELLGEAITSDEYLENALKLRKGDTDEIQKYNKVCSYLRESFAVRKCFVFQPPTDPSKMGCLEKLQDKELNPSFLEKTNEFCQYIFTESKIKTMRGGLGLTGRMLSTLAETYVEAIRGGQVPSLDSAVESLTRIHNSRAVTEAVEFYRSEMSRRVSFPTENQQEFSDIHVSVGKTAISIFINGSFNDEYGKYQLELKERLEEEYQEFNEQNKEESRKMCKSIISQVFGPLEKAVIAHTYMQPGGYSKFYIALERTIKKYRSEKRRGVKSEEVLTTYLTEKSGVGQTILNADTFLSEDEKKMEEEQMQIEAAEQEKRKLEEERKIQDQLMIDEQRLCEEHIMQLKAKMDEQQKLAKEELDRTIHALHEEQKMMLEDSFDENAAKMQTDIEKLQNTAQSDKAYTMCLLV